MPDHDSEIYRELLSEFRNGYSRYGAPRSVLCLEVMTFDEYDVRMGGKFKTAVLDVAGYVPVSEDGSKRPWWIVATVAGQMFMESLEAELVRDGCTGPRLDRLGSPEIYFAMEREAWEVYQPLIAHAGGHLPAAIRSALPYQPLDPPSWWLSTMWYSKRPWEEDLAGPPKKLRVIWNNPFLDAAETIERCGLTTDSPVLVPGNGAWAIPEEPGGNARNSVAQVEEEPKSNRGVKGVSLRDAAEMIRRGNPGEQAALVKAWQSSRIAKLPQPIGKCPGHSQRNLYKPAALIEFLEKVEGEGVDRDFDLNAHFQRVSRKPRR